MRAFFPTTMNPIMDNEQQLKIQKIYQVIFQDAYSSSKKASFPKRGKVSNSKTLLSTEQTQSENAQIKCLPLEKGLFVHEII